MINEDFWASFQFVVAQLKIHCLPPLLRNAWVGLCKYFPCQLVGNVQLRHRRSTEWSCKGRDTSLHVKMADCSYSLACPPARLLHSRVTPQPSSNIRTSSYLLCPLTRSTTRPLPPRPTGKFLHLSQARCFPLGRSLILGGKSLVPSSSFHLTPDEVVATISCLLPVVVYHFLPESN